MARTKKTARDVKAPDRCKLLQWMGFPRQSDAMADVANVRANWPAVVERLAHHPNEALHTYDRGRNNLHDCHRQEHHQDNCLYPLQLALKNQRTPVTREALEALIRTYPRVLPMLDLSDETWKSNNNGNGDGNGNGTPVAKTEIMEIMQLAKRTYLCVGNTRTKTFQLMGLPASSEEVIPAFHFNDFAGGTRSSYHVDWPTLETHLSEHPEEAKIMCCCPGRTNLQFPLEVALQFAHPPVPLRTVELLLRIYPEVLTIPDSPALYFACCLRQREDPEVIRAILRGNPALTENEMVGTGFPVWENTGLPIHEAVKLPMPCAVQILPDLIQANPASLAAQTDLWKQIPLQVAADMSMRLPTDLWRLLLEQGHRHGVCAEYAGGQLFFVANGEDDDLRSAMDEIFDTPGVSEELWQNLRHALQAAGAFRTKICAERMWEYPILHAAVEFGRRRRFVWDRVREETTPEDRKRVDALGRTPLAVAIETAHSKHNNDYPWDDEDEEDFLKLNTVMRRLLDSKFGWPQSASIPITSIDDDRARTSSLPLHKALHQGIGMEDGLTYIVNAFPAALSIPDPESGLIPCLLAAVSERTSLNTIFGLMNRRPNLIADICQHVKTKGTKKRK